jgi:bifunctional DNase/RNase
MEGEMDREEHSKEKYPIMMDQEEIQEIMQKAGMTRSGRPYQYKLNRKKRAVAEREGLESDEEEVEDLCVVEHIEEILCATYERNTRGGDLMRKQIPLSRSESV